MMEDPGYRTVSQLSEENHELRVRLEAAQDRVDELELEAKEADAKADEKLFQRIDELEDKLAELKDQAESHPYTTCPACGDQLVRQDLQIICSRCRREWKLTEVFWPVPKKTERVRLNV